MNNLNNEVLKLMSDCLIKINFYRKYRELCENHLNNKACISFKKDEMGELLKETGYNFKYISKEKEFMYMINLKTFSLKLLISSYHGSIIPIIVLDLIDENQFYLISEEFRSLGDRFEPGYRESLIENPWPYCKSITDARIIIKEILDIFKAIENCFIQHFGQNDRL